MAVTVFIPEIKKKKADRRYSAYIHGKVVGKYYEKGVGSLFRVEGTAVIFYAFSNYRRAIVFSEDEDKYGELPLLQLHIPLVKQKVMLLYSAERRRFDILKHIVYRTEREFGERIFGWGPGFWLRVISLLDNYKPSVRRSAAKASNIRMVARAYERRHKNESD